MEKRSDNMLPITIPQKNIWNLQQFYSGSSISNISGMLLLESRCDLQLLIKAINIFVKNHDGIRLRFTEQGSAVFQYAAPYEPVDISMMHFKDMDEARDFLKADGKKPFVMTDFAMYRFYVFDTPKQSGVYLCFSHLVSDAWTLSLFCSKVAVYYERLEQGLEITENAPSYLEHIRQEKVYLQSERYRKDASYWEHRFEERPYISQIRPASAEPVSAEAERLTKTISSGMTSDMKKWCTGNRISLAVLFEAAVFAYLYRINEKPKETFIGTLVLNRMGRPEKETAGMYVSTMPLGVSVTGEDTASSLCEKIAAAHMAVFRHQKYPYENILKMVRNKWNCQGNLFDVMVSYQNARITDTQDGKIAGYHTEWFSNGYSEVALALHIDDRDRSGCLTVNMDYQTGVFHDDEAELLYERLYFIIEQLMGDPGVSVDSLVLVPEAEYRKVVYNFNDTAVEYPKEKCIHELFTEMAKTCPDKTALVFEEKRFTYRQLDEMSNSLAHDLRGRGVKPNDVVPIIARRSWHIITAMLGILKAGGAYMPVDPSYPADRIEYMIAVSNAHIALVYGYTGTLRVPELQLGDFDYARNRGHMDNVNGADDLCYVMFTSGSTGRPKGVAICHKNLQNYCDNNAKNLCQKIIKPHISSIVSVANTIFDMFVTESIFSLLNGITIYFANGESVVSQAKLSRLIIKNKIEVIQTTPTKMRSYILDKENMHYLKELKIIILGGEPLTAELFLLLKKYTDAVIVNIYGPTETTVCSTGNIVEDTDITIGKPIANTQIYILDKGRKPLPIGVAGELCISGDGVGRGYLNQPELTAEKFIPNPFLAGKTMYCTGDLARWRTDGKLECLGRIDTQVKIRGLRIELGEIESVMNTFPGIGLAAAADKRDDNGRQYLAGYYVSGREVDEKQLRRHLSAKLPAYMVPNYFMRLDAMPMTAGGKIDRKNLLVPVFGDRTEGYEEPVTRSEKILAGIWKGLLHYDTVGRNTDFIESGGDSLGAISMLALIEQEFGVHMEMRIIMEHTRLSDLAGCIERAECRADAIPVRNQKTYILTPQQKALYLACRKEPGSLVYHIPVFIRLDKDADMTKIKADIQRSYRRHPVLRTAVSVRGDEIVGRIEDGAPLVFEEFHTVSSFLRPFDLSKAPLIRVGFGCGGMALDIHHLVADGESLNQILDEIFRGRKEPEKVSYADYAAYFHSRLASGGFDRHKAYFKKTLHAEIERLELPETPGAQGAGTVCACMLEGAAVDNARNYAKSHNLTETCVYLAAYGMLLSAFANRRRVISSIILSNRTHADIQAVCGMFVNTIPLVMDVNPEISFAEYADKLNQMLLEVYQYQELPFLEICEAVGIRDKNAINTAFVYQPGEKKAEGIEFEYIDTKTYKMDLSFQVLPQPDGSCRIMLEYNCHKYGSGLMKRLADGYGRLLSQISGARILKDFSVMDEAEYRRVVYGFNQTVLHDPKQRTAGCVHEMFVEQAVKWPEKIVLVFGQQSFTYRQLDEMTNALAHYLREKGIRPNDIVPIISKRSWHAAAAMLGVLKAGGAYMPVDPDYPKERILYMLREAGSRIALTYGIDYAVSMLAEADGTKPAVECIDLDTFDYASNRKPLANANVPEDLCYVIFTSGSTGRPKGVLLKHAGLANFIGSESDFHSAVQKCSKALAIGSFTFDISIGELFQPLLNGGSVVIADEETVNSAQRMAAAIREYHIDLLHTTSTRLGYYFDNAEFGKAASGLKVILSAGEAFSAELYTKIRKYTDAEIYNGYGPTETTVGCSFAKVEAPDDITIGKPISNVQIYILGHDGNPCPIGTAGELCIAGAGVAKGYLNRPKLTAEKFVPDPFIKGGRMYRSGDLARWRMDGRAEYLGRMDSQVKIRGLRIELGEIEAAVSSFAGVNMCAVTDGLDADGRQYLAAYYTSRKVIDEKRMREYLAERLPRYMVPNYLVRLLEIPLTVSGKTDRKRLPLPDPAMNTAGYEAPRNAVEQTLCGIVSRILNFPQVGRNDDFFALGGDSLRAIEYTSEAADRGIAFGLQAVFEYPTVAGLCGYVLDSPDTMPDYVQADFEKYAEILGENRESSVLGIKGRLGRKAEHTKYRTLGNVLLTGATGYLGAHILDSLMKQDTGVIYCLIRDSDLGSRRLAQTLRYYFGTKYDGEAGRRIVPIIGDMTDGHIMMPKEYSIQTVIHAAADVRHFGSYSEFYHTNVIGTRNMLCIAKERKARFLYISTVSVGGMWLTKKGNGKAVFRESDLYIGQNLKNVYLRSKFEAERLVLDARLEGCNCTVFRVGNLTNRYSDGMFQPNYKENAFYRRIKTFVDLKCYPSALSIQRVEFSPVDCTAEAIVRLAEYADLRYSVFHVNHPHGLTYGQFAGMLGMEGHCVEPAATEQFLQKAGIHADHAYDAVKNELRELASMAEYTRVISDSTFTEKCLEETGFIWKDITQEYIGKYVRYFDRARQNTEVL